MKKLAEKKTNNKGFSLVELIIVVAIMAVLIGVLAPQYMRYLEKTRVQKDNSAISEIANAIKNAGAEETIYDEIATKGTTGVEIVAEHKANTNQKFSFDESTSLKKELKITIGDEVSTTSKQYKDGADLSFVVKIDTNGIVEVTVKNWYDPATKTTADKVF
jgi:type IV pilus assembly protein PilA